MREREAISPSRAMKRERERDNLLLGIISFDKIHDINALHKYSHVNKGILNRNFI